MRREEKHSRRYGGKIRPVSHKRKLQVAPKSLTHTVQKVTATCRPPWEIQRRQGKSVSVLRESRNE